MQHAPLNESSVLQVGAVAQVTGYMCRAARAFFFKIFVHTRAQPGHSMSDPYMAQVQCTFLAVVAQAVFNLKQ